jgi:hypothetical protein
VDGSILILENNDIAPTNHAVIGDAVRTLVANRNDVPDEIFLVDRRMDGLVVIPWRRVDEETATRYSEISPKGLDLV